MAQQQSPWIEGAYGWNFGEGGWNTGMDQNLLKFSFMFDRNVDSITAALPAAVSGQAHYLTTDNRLYFAVGSTYFSTPVPKWFTITVRGTGAIWQFNGTSLVQIDSPQQLDSRIDAVELTVSSLGTAAFQNTEFFAEQAELDVVAAQSANYTDTLRTDLTTANDSSKGSGIVPFDITLAYPIGSVGDTLKKSNAASVSGIVNLLTATVIPDRAIIVHGYLTGTDTGGGVFTWDATQLKSTHDGRKFISPTVPWDGLAGTLAAFLAGTGETNPAGTGCWVRMIESHEVEVDSYGGVTAATLNNAVLDLDTGNAIYTGGQIAVPVGQHSINSTVNVNNSSASDIQGVTLKGRGKQASTLDFTGQPAGQNGIDFMTPIFAGVEDMSVRNCTLSGVKLTGQPTIPGAVSWNHFNMDRARLSFNGKDGLEADRGFMGHFNQVFATHNAEQGMNFKGLHTSLLLSNCYAASNTQIGFALEEPTYSVLNACAADTNGLYGYSIVRAAGTVLNGCGSESNGRSGLAVTSSTANGENKPVLVDGFFAFNNNTANAGFPNAIYVQAQDNVPSVVVARGCRSFSPANPTTDATVTGVGAYLVDEYNDFPNGVAAVSGGYIHHVAKTHLVRALSVTAATNVVELQSTQGGQTSFSGEVLITASNTQPSNTRVGNNATYKLLVHKDAAGVSVVEISKIGQTTGAGASAPSFTWSISGNFLRATPVGSTSGTFYFEIMTQGPVKVK